MIAVLELTPAATGHFHHVGLREIAPAILVVVALLLVFPVIFDVRAAAHRDHDDGDEP